MSEHPRPPLLGAFVAGYPAAIVARVLREHLGEELARCAADGRMRAAALATQEQIEAAAQAWRALAMAASEAGRADVRDGTGRAGSVSDEIDVKGAAELLGYRDPRQARRLAASLGGRKVGHQWVLSRSAVLAYAESRAAA